MRRAIAMIELIFAIVIMGIVLMSAPTLMATAARSVTVTLQQEGINEASARIAIMMTYPWDQNDINTTCSRPAPVLVVTNGDDQLDKPAGSIRRRGVPMTSNSRLFYDPCTGRQDISASVSLGQEGTQIDDLDDFTDTTLTLVENAAKDYVEKATVSIATQVTYGTDSANYDHASINFVPANQTGTTNIKNITVTLTSTSGVNELQKTIVMRAFSCNIGGYDYEKRTF
jgi:hypothetical protein